MPLTCSTCKVLFESAEDHRSHYRSEWHRYNLKRKIAELPTVTFNEFKERETAYRQETAPISQRNFTCKPCGKNFNSENALQSHLKSKKHTEATNKESVSVVELGKNVRNSSADEVNCRFLAERKNPECDSSELLQIESEDEILTEDDDDDWESVDEEEIPVVPTNICLFCNNESSDTEENVQHMKTSHSFYIPDTEYLINREELLCYLGQKVTYGFTCLSCNLQKRSAHSIQQHMLDKGHCRINLEGNSAEEYEDFYNYTASYPDYSENPDEEVPENVLEPNGYELTLPSGVTVGHRSLALYYRQNLKPVKDAASKRAKFIHKYHAICQGGQVGTSTFYKSAAYKYALQRQKRYFLKLGLKQNKLFWVHVQK